ncbi:hypothetical protein RJ641_005340 [Dillenia turbinata]|uniref:Uncharacterized protein n=1 Tax=Dillenia turbinata TaxID=194707 RepID=A0AAN8V7V3_9MAGN
MIRVRARLPAKTESATDVQSEFERVGGVREVHLDECMSHASCSSTRTPDDEDEDGSDQLVAGDADQISREMIWLSLRPLGGAIPGF